MSDLLHRLTRTHIEVTKPGVCVILGCVPIWGTARHRAAHTVTYVITEGRMHYFAGEDQLEGLAEVETIGELNAWLRQREHVCTKCVRSDLVRRPS